MALCSDMSSSVTSQVSVKIRSRCPHSNAKVPSTVTYLRVDNSGHLPHILMSWNVYKLALNQRKVRITIHKSMKEVGGQ